jgi:predicted tellurium resistance membrane protein TerC
MKKYLVFIGIGFEMLGIVAACLWLGILIEARNPMKNLWPVILVFVGLSGWFYRVVKLLKNMNNKNEK